MNMVENAVQWKGKNGNFPLKIGPALSNFNVGLMSTHPTGAAEIYIWGCWGQFLSKKKQNV